MTDSEILTRVMKSTGLTPPQFAKRLGMKRPEVLYRVTRGDNGISKQLKRLIIEAFDVNLNYFNSGEGPIFAGQQKTEATGSLDFLEECTLFPVVYGDSMLPDYAPGEILMCKQITNLDIIPFGEAYYLELKESANSLSFVKLVFDKDASSFIVRSKNPEYKGDIVLQKNDIERLYIVMGKIKRNIV